MSSLELRKLKQLVFDENIVFLGIKYIFFLKAPETKGISSSLDIKIGL